LKIPVASETAILRAIIYLANHRDLG